MDLRNNLIGCIGKTVSYELTHYLVTDVFKIPCIGKFGVTLIRLKDNLIITRLVCGVLTDQGSGNFRGFNIEIPIGFPCSLILCTPSYNSDTIKNLMDKTDRLPKIVKFIKGFCSSYIRYFYLNRDKHFDKLPVYKRTMRELLKSYLNPENCIIQDGKRV